MSSEVWNDRINGNNVTTNWFEGMQAEFANIYASPGVPYNQCCKKYFQITDLMMLKSILSGKRAGKILSDSDTDIGMDLNEAEAEPKRLYTFLKSISGDFLRLVRELLWLMGKYDVDALKKFIDDFKPDVIFSERMASCKMLRLEKIVAGITDAPIFAFTGDDEYSLRQLKFSPFFWMNRIMVRKMLRQMVKKYKIYYTLSEEQKVYYEKEFGCRCEILRKCGESATEYNPHKVHKPVKMIYAGKFYCNRWKMLAKIVDVLKEINCDETKIILEIYTRDIPTKQQKKLLDDGKNSFIKGGVSQEKLKRIYQNADVALHVESIDRKNRLATRLSFSTKIIDCIFSGCAVMAFCWNQHSGWTYLKREDAAICVSSEEELRHELKKICRNPSYVDQYAKKAYLCGRKNHRKEEVQKKLLKDFKAVIE